jgi:hypothetical protein
VQAALGRSKEALKRYQTARAIRRKLAEEGSESADWQNDLVETWIALAPWTWAGARRRSGYAHSPTRCS